MALLTDKTCTYVLQNYIYKIHEPCFSVYLSQNWNSLIPDGVDHIYLNSLIPDGVDHIYLKLKSYFEKFKVQKSTEFGSQSYRSDGTI